MNTYMIEAQGALLVSKADIMQKINLDLVVSEMAATYKDSKFVSEVGEMQRAYPSPFSLHVNKC